MSDTGKEPMFLDGTEIHDRAEVTSSERSVLSVVAVETPPVEAAQAPHAEVHVIETREEYLEAVSAIASGTGPVAIDAERASGFRYSQRAYLIQIFRRGSGVFLFDPPAIGSFAELDAVIRDEEWVLHAASQDLACLREVGLDPTRIFDTELGARLAGLPRVGLGTVVEDLLGIHLAKEHSAADWSTRPLPQSWLVYAALDVELLPDLRDAMAALLEDAGKSEIARQEFSAVLTREAKVVTGDACGGSPASTRCAACTISLSLANCGRHAIDSPAKSTQLPADWFRIPRSSPPQKRCLNPATASHLFVTSAVAPVDRNSRAGGPQSRWAARPRTCPLCE